MKCRGMPHSFLGNTLPPKVCLLSHETNYLHVLQCSKIESLRPEILQKFNHILRKFKNEDRQNQHSNVTGPWGIISTFLYSGI